MVSSCKTEVNVEVFLPASERIHVFLIEGPKNVGKAEEDSSDANQKLSDLVRDDHG